MVMWTFFISVFSNASVDLTQPIVTHCNSGMSSCAVAFTVELLGGIDASVYHVSWPLVFWLVVHIYHAI